MTDAAAAISVNGNAIPAAAIAAETQNHPAPTPQAARAAAAQALVVRELLLQEAARIGIVAEPMVDAEGRRETDEDARIRALLEREVAVPTADAATCRRYYDNNPRRFISPDVFEASHILLSAPQSDAEAYAKAIAEARRLIAALNERPEAFAALARDFSACPSAREGGSLGQLTRGQTTPEFETFLLALEEGQLCPVPVETPYGVHVVKLHRRVAGRPLPFDHVAGAIAAYLQDVSWRTAARQYVEILAGRAKIDGIAVQAAETALVR